MEQGRKTTVIVLALLVSIFLFGLVSAVDFTPQGDINLRDVYSIKNGVNSTFDYYCNATSCYTITELMAGGEYYAGGVYIDLNGSNYFILNETKLNSTIDDRDTDTTYSAGSNLSLVGTTFSLDTTGVLSWLDNIYVRISNLVGLVGNWSADKPDYSTTVEANNLYVNLTGDTMTGDLNMGNNDIWNVNTINVSNITYVYHLQSFDGNSILVQPTGDEDDFFSFKTPLDRPTIKREGGKYIYFESSNVYDVGISFRKDDTYSGTLAYAKDDNIFKLLGKDSPIALIPNSEYVNYLLFETFNHQPQISVFNGTILKINDSLEVIGDGNFTGTLYYGALDGESDLNVNSSSYWDGLNSPSDIETGDLINDGTYYLNSNPSGFYNSTNPQTETDPIYSAWDNFTGIPTAAPSNGDTTHLSTADQIYDWVIGLSYATTSYVDGLIASVGNWSNDKGDYYTSAQVDSGFATIDEPLWSGNSSTVARIGDCPAGQFVQNTTTGGVECSAPAGGGDITGVIAGTGLLGGGLSGDVTLNASADTCGAGNVSKYNGTHFNCVEDQGAAYTAGSNLTLAANEFSLDTSGVRTWLDNVYVQISNIVGLVGNWSADKGDYSTTAEADALYRAESWDNFTGIPTATPSNGDTTHLSTADHIYDWVIGLGYSTTTGTVTSVAAGNGMDFSSITGSGSVTMGTPGTLSGSTSNGVTATSHTHSITTDDSGDCAAGVICGGGHTHSEYLESLLEDTTPQLGGYLDTNGENIGSTADEIENVYVATNSRTYYGDGQEASVYYNGTNLIIAG